MNCPACGELHDGPRNNADLAHALQHTNNYARILAQTDIEGAFRYLNVNTLSLEAELRGLCPNCGGLAYAVERRVSIPEKPVLRALPGGKP